MQVHTILAAATAGASGAENYPYLLGLLAIVIALVAIFRVSALRQELEKSSQRQLQAPPAPATKAPAPAQSAAAEGIPQEIVAVIAAAVATMTGGSRRVLSIKPMSTSWERAGRQSVLTSHRIR